MPQCPRCQSPYPEGQRFCSQCGASLVSVEAPVAAAVPPRSGPSMQPWIVGLLLAAGVIILVLLVLLFNRSAPPPSSVPPPAPQAAAPAAPAPAPAAAPAPTVAPPGEPAPESRTQVQSVLNALREAHLHKDLDKYLRCYSSAFPDREKKQQDVRRAWDNFDFINVYFTIDDLRPVNPDTVNATVTWNIDTRNRRTQEFVSAKQTYRVRLVRELGNWRILDLEEGQ